MLCNIEIRKKIKDAGLHHWQVADMLEISETTFCRMLRKELDDERKKTVLDAINSACG